MKAYPIRFLNGSARVRRAVIAAWALPIVAHSQPLDSASLAGFRWRNIGPAEMGGRVSDVEGIPSPSHTFYVATATGGIWKTTNAGTTFSPIFDNERVISMGDIAIAPSDTNQIWAGTGESNVRNSVSPGGGVYKSTNGGASFYRYQWWLPSGEGDFNAEGILGQYIYVDPQRELVMVRLGGAYGGLNWTNVFRSLAPSYSTVH